MPLFLILALLAAGGFAIYEVTKTPSNAAPPPVPPPPPAAQPGALGIPGLQIPGLPGLPASVPTLGQAGFSGLVSGHGYRVSFSLGSALLPWNSTTANAAVNAAMLAFGFQPPLATLVNADADTGAFTATSAGLYKGLGVLPVIPSLTVTGVTEVTLPPPGVFV